MKILSKEIILKMNKMGRERIPFVFIIDFEGRYPFIFEENEFKDKILWKTPHYGNISPGHKSKKEFSWDISPVSFLRYQKAFNIVNKRILKGDSYLINLTMPSDIKTDLSLEELFYMSDAPYRIYLKDKFICFSPEIFVRIENGKISSFPMKGTIDADIPDAENILRHDKKEIAEHNTIVDLIRNDLSMVAEGVMVKRFGYIEKIKSNCHDLLQMSSEITGQLSVDYREHLGDIFEKILPAGSITGAPKRETVNIIKEAENYQRGYYSGVFGYFDGDNVDSCVMIRYIEQNNGNLCFKSGGGITSQSDCRKEYQELIQKIYVPVN